MTIFKKISPLEGNPMRTDGTPIVFDGLYFETDDELDIEFLSKFKQYKQVEAREEVETKKPEAKAATGTISAASLAKMAAANK